MPSLSREGCAILKATIDGLSEKGCKQALWGMVEVLRGHPSILEKDFSLIVEDARKYSDFKKEY